LRKHQITTFLNASSYEALSQENCQFLELFEITGTSSSLIYFFIYKKTETAVFWFSLKEQKPEIIKKIKYPTNTTGYYNTALPPPIAVKGVRKGIYCTHTDRMEGLAELLDMLQLIQA
jgi:hypothetical protein